MNLDKIHSVYFLGIGGIGMSALARWFKANGYNVAGYDRTPTPLTNQLKAEAIDVHFEDSIDSIPEYITSSADDCLVVYTPAIPSDHQEYNYLKSEGFQILKRSQVLGELTKTHFTIAVAGTHGKTTTSSIIAHVLHANGLNCTAFVGGIMTNYDSNLIIGKSGDESIMVVEADEFDRSFLTLHPDIAVITAVDADHLDIYGSADFLKESFKEFIMKIKNSGQLFIEERAATKIDLKQFDNIQIKTYGIGQGEIFSDQIHAQGGTFSFDYKYVDGLIENIEFNLPGYHNVENATAAISVSKRLGISDSDIKSTLGSYVGVKRRFEYIIKSDDLIFIDDYAHHPEEINALLRSVKFLFPEKHITAIFQPHLFTRTRDFAEGFSESLSLADDVILLEIYPAREQPIEGVSSAMLLSNIASSSKGVVTKEDLVAVLKSKNLEVLITIGAGDIDALVNPIKTALSA